MAESTKKEDKKPLSMKKIGDVQGSSGTQIQNGIITNEEYNRELTGVSGNRVYERMRRSDSTVRASLLVCKLPLLSSPWSIKAASDDPKDIEIADFVRRELFNRHIEFPDFLREALTMLDFGFSVFEKEYELTDYEGKPRIGLARLGSRKQVTILKWEKEDGGEGVTQQLLTGQTSIDRERLMIFTHEKEGDNHEGISMLRFSYKHWFMKDKLYLIDAIKLERQGLGIIDIAVPDGANEADVTTAVDLARSVRANEEGYMKHPAGWDIAFMDMKANTTADILPSISHHDRQITKSVLAQFLELGGSDASGSRAVSEDHSKLFMLAEEATAKTLKAAIEKQLIQQLVDLNYADKPNGYPSLDFGRIGEDNMTTVAEAVSKLVAANALTPDAEMEEHLRTALHLPGMPEDYKEDYSNRPGLNTPALPTGNTGGDKGDTNITADALKDAKRAKGRLIAALGREYAKSE